MPRKSVKEEKIIVFMRHSITPTTGVLMPGKTPGLFLSKQGIELIETIGKELGDCQEAKETKSFFTRIVSSPVDRAMQTASIVGRCLNLPVEGKEEFSECDPGDLTGMKLKDLPKLSGWKTLYSWPENFAFPGGESIIETYTRVGRGIKDVLSQQSAGVTLVVSHADPIKLAIVFSLGLALKDFHKFDIRPASSTVISYGSSGGFLRATNLLSGREVFKHLS